MTATDQKQNTVIKTTEKTVRCDGESRDSGHPVIYIAFGNATHVVCDYCSQEFVLQKDAS